MAVHAISANGLHTIHACDFVAWKTRWNANEAAGLLETEYYVLDTYMQLESHMVLVGGEWQVLRERGMSELGRLVVSYHRDVKVAAAYLASVTAGEWYPASSH